jgi:hypothetical protein
LRLERDDLVELPFHDDLVSDDYEPCRAIADGLRADGAAGLIVPSAALPGTKNVVLFGARVAAPYSSEPLSGIDVPTSITGERGQALVTLLALVRFAGQPHPGASFQFEEPSWELDPTGL